MKTKNFFLFTVVLLVLSSCGEDWMKKHKISDNYYFTHDGSWGLAYIISTIDGIIIDMEVVAWNFDSTFIIAKQKPFRAISDSLHSKYPNLPSNKRDKMYNEIKVYNYWIIDKREELKSYFDEEKRKRVYTRGLYGPFTREEYWEKRRELGVQDSLRLRETRWRGRPLVRTQQAVIE